MRNQDCLQSYEDLKLAAVGGFAEKDEWIENVVARFLHFTPKGREDCIRTWMVANTDHPTYEWTQEAVAVLKTFESAEERSPETKPKPKPRFIHKKKDVLDKILTTLERFPQRGFSAQEISNLMHSGRALATIKRYLHELYLTQ